MNRIKLYLIGTVVVLFFSMAFAIHILSKKTRAQTSEITRLETNWFNSIQDGSVITNLLIKEKEQTRALTLAKDSIAKALKIKPKYIERIIYIDNSTHDTIKVPVLTTIVKKGYWTITDSGKCFKWAGNASTMGDSLKVTRTLFEYDNKTTQVFYKKAPHIWFLRTGKWKYSQQISSECGETKLNDITFIR